MSFVDQVRERLEAAAQRGELTSIHCDPGDLEAFIVGMVERTDSEGFVFRMIDTHGQDDGFQPTRWDEVLAFHSGSEYLARVAALRDHPLKAYGALPDIPTDPVEALRYAKEKRFVVSLRDASESHQGYVREVGKGWVEIEPIVENGIIDGLYLLDLDRIDRIRIGGFDEQEMEHLHRIRYGG